MNDNQLWTDVDRYFTNSLVHSDPVLDAVLKESEAAGLPPISVSPTLGKLLYLLAKIQNAGSILEIGTLAGYSTIWMARALAQGGRVITLEYEPKHAEIARKNFARAGLSEVIEVPLGPALDTLPKLAAEKRGPFDLIFIDADKENNAEYFAWSLKMSRRGTLIIIDNVVRKGAVVDAASTDASVQGVRRLIDLLAAERRISATAIQSVGIKGYDGFAIALVMDDP